MSLIFTADTLRAAYDFLNETPPFNRWNLPDGESVKFAVGKFRDKYAQYQWDGKQHTIALSNQSIGHTLTLMVALSHEMIHMHLEENGLESRRGDRNTHNAAFRKFAEQVCKAHGFDLKAFY